MRKKLDQHELLSKLKDQAIELGYTPSMPQFLEFAGISKHQIILSFGAWIPFIQAAGLPPPGKPKKIDNSIFSKDLGEHLKEYAEDPRPQVLIEKPTAYPRIAVISDIHWPFHCQRVIDKFYDFIEQHKPKHVIINGDAVDFYAYSKFSKSMNGYSPREETSLARKNNEDFWQEVQKRCPETACYQLLGNHCIRPMKQILDAYPEAEDWVADGLRKMFTFDGVKTIYDHREELVIAGIAFHHGYRTKLGDARDYMLMSTCAGHSHTGGCVYRKIHGKVLFELNSGYAGDPESKGLSYTNQKMSGWTPGFGFIWEWGPQFVPA